MSKAQTRAFTTHTDRRRPGPGVAQSRRVRQDIGLACRRAAAGLLVAVAALLALPLQAQAQTISIGAETDGTGDAEGVEGDTIELTVKLSAVSTGAVTAKWRYVLGTARSGDASHDGNQNLMIAAGDTTDTISVDLVDDDKYEDEESFEIELYDVVGATIARSLAQITIEVDTSNPDLPSFQVVPTTVDVNEGNGTVTVQVVHDAFTAQDVDITITYQTADGTATQPDDYTATIGTLTFPAGSRTTRTVTIPIVNDTDEEEDETFEVEFGTPSVGAFDSGGAKATVTIEDNDQAVPRRNISIADASAAENAGHLLFDVTLSRSWRNTVKVDFETISGGTATEGEDYHARRTYTHVILAGDKTAQMGFALIEDTVNDPDETVKVRLSNARVVDAYGDKIRDLAITRAEATGTITAPPPSTSDVSNLNLRIDDATGDEDDSFLRFNVRLSRKYTEYVCYDFETVSGGNATEGLDYDRRPKVGH